MANIDKPIFAPDQYTDAHDRMLAELHKEIMDVRRDIEEILLAFVEQARRRDCAIQEVKEKVNELEAWYKKSITDGK